VNSSTEREIERELAELSGSPVSLVLASAAVSPAPADSLVAAPGNSAADAPRPAEAPGRAEGGIVRRMTRRTNRALVGAYVFAGCTVGAATGAAIATTGEPKDIATGVVGSAVFGGVAGLVALARRRASKQGA
jgi:hypothetical protein